MTKLRIQSPNGKNFTVTTEDGQIVEGIDSVDWHTNWVGSPKIVFRMSRGVEIDVSMEESGIAAVARDGNKFAFLKWLQIRKRTTD